MIFLWGMGAVCTALACICARMIYLKLSGKIFIAHSYYEKNKNRNLYVFFQIEVKRPFKKTKMRTAFLKVHEGLSAEHWKDDIGKRIFGVLWVEDGKHVSDGAIAAIKTSLSRSKNQRWSDEALNVMIDGLDTDSTVEALEKANKEIEALKKQIPYDDGMIRVRVAGKVEQVPVEIIEDLLMYGKRGRK